MIIEKEESHFTSHEKQFDDDTSQRAIFFENTKVLKINEKQFDDDKCNLADFLRCQGIWKVTASSLTMRHINSLWLANMQKYLKSNDQLFHGETSKLSMLLENAKVIKTSRNAIRRSQVQFVRYLWKCEGIYKVKKNSLRMDNFIVLRFSKMQRYL